VQLLRAVGKDPLEGCGVALDDLPTPRLLLLAARCGSVIPNLMKATAF
jgi:hypothetical protein